MSNSEMTTELDLPATSESKKVNGERQLKKVLARYIKFNNFRTSDKFVSK